MNKLLTMLKAKVSGDKTEVRVSEMKESMCGCGGDCGCGHGDAHSPMHEHVCECGGNCTC